MFKASLGYTESTSPVRAVWKDHVSTKWGQHPLLFAGILHRVKPGRCQLEQMLPLTQRGLGSYFKGSKGVPKDVGLKSGVRRPSLCSVCTGLDYKGEGRPRERQAGVIYGQSRRDKVDATVWTAS